MKIMGRTMIMTILSVGLAPLLGILEKYVYDDWDYLKFLVVLMVVDTILGFYRHFRLHTLSSAAWSKISDKMITYFALLVIVHVMSHFTLDKEPVTVLVWVKYLAYSSLIVQESISVVTNVGAINPKFVPKNLLKRLKEFDVNGKFLG